MRKSRGRFCSRECLKLRRIKYCHHCGREVRKWRRYDYVYCSTACYKAEQYNRGSANKGAFQPGRQLPRNHPKARLDIWLLCSLPGCGKNFTMKRWEYRQRRQSGCNNIFCCREHWVEFQRRYRKKNHVKGNCKSSSIYQSRKARGVCPRCCAKPLEGHVMCPTCNEKAKEHAREKRRKKR